MVVTLKVFTKFKEFTRNFDSLKEAVDDAILTLQNDTAFPTEITVDGVTVWMFITPKGDFSEVEKSLRSLLDLVGENKVIVIY